MAIKFKVLWLLIIVASLLQITACNPCKNITEEKCRKRPECSGCESLARANATCNIDNITEDVIPNFKASHQEASNWCWAACIEAAGNHINQNTLLKQCEIVKENLNISICCDTIRPITWSAYPSRCNIDNALSEILKHDRDNAKQYFSTTMDTRYFMLPQLNILKKLISCQKSPLILMVSQNPPHITSKNHYVLVSGYQILDENQIYVTIRNPFVDANYDARIPASTTSALYNVGSTKIKFDNKDYYILEVYYDIKKHE